jgi:hypothetical protein
MKHFFSILLLVALVAGIAFGEVGRVGKKQSMRADDGTTSTAVANAPVATQPDNSLFKTNAVSWVLVDEAQNPLGALGWNIQPFAYDPYSDVLAFIHRGRTTYAAGSGQLWYNISTDPTSWSRVSALNAGVATLSSRYPSAALSNPTKSTDPANVRFVYSAPELTPVTGSSFGALRYGYDNPIGAAAPVSFEQEPPPTFGSGTNVWASQGSAWVYWVAYATDSASGNGYWLYKTNGYASVTKSIPTGWKSSDFQSDYAELNGFSQNGVEYLGMLAQFGGDTLATPNPNFSYDYNVGYSKSTDNGTTWSAWVRPQLGAAKSWNAISGFGPSYFIAGGYTSSRPNAHLVVDANNHAHFVTVVVDTLTNTYSVAEIYETGSGWASKMVKSGLNRKTIQAYVDVDQAAWDLSPAISADGKILSVFWLDAATAAATDTLPDIWMSSRNLTSAAWSTPVNVTATPAAAELGMHVAPYLKSLGSNQYTAFLSREYEVGRTAFPPTSSSTAAEIFAGTYTFTQVASAVEDQPGVPAKFELGQNYPNPFNPSTTISYTLSHASQVQLTVVNTLGQEVATLVNEDKPAGSYTVNFNAGKLASGVYFYTLKANGFTDVKMMVLMK